VQVRSIQDPVQLARDWLVNSMPVPDGSCFIEILAMNTLKGLALLRDQKKTHDT
jgi:hypothetical protein